MLTDSLPDVCTSPVRADGRWCQPRWINTLPSFEEFEKSLECKVCFKTLEDPVSFGMCEHSFCRHCISKHVGKSCPLCFTPADAKDTQDDYQLSMLVSLSHQLRNLLTTFDAFENSHNKSCVDTAASCRMPNHKSSMSNEQIISPVTSFHENVINNKLNISDQAGETNLNISAIFEEKDEFSHIANRNSGRRHENSGVKQRVLSCNPYKNNTNTSGNTSRQRISSDDPVTPVTCKKRNSYAQNSNRRCGRRTSAVKMKDVSSPANKLKRNAKGETPLHIAAIKGDIAAVEEFLDRGVNPNLKDNAGWTPLHEACNHGYEKIVELLLDNGALVNIPGCENETPLHDAVLNNQIEVVKLLVAAGADLNARNSRGLSPLQIKQTEEMKAALLQTTPLSLVSSPLVNTKELIPSKEKITIVATGLDNTQKSLLQKCATMLKATISHDFSPEVTHVVTVCDDTGHCPRTLKFLYGVISAKWIVNFHWVELCLEYRQKIPEEVFEVQGTTQQLDSKGPMRARINAHNQFPPLFDGCKFYFIGNFVPPAPPRALLMILVRMGGGTVLAREPRPSVITSEQCVVPYHIPADSPLAEVNHFIVYQGPSPRSFTIDGPVCCVPVFWLLDSISAFMLQPLPTG